MGTITLKYFGALAELTGKESEELKLNEAVATVQAIRSFCQEKYPGFNQLSYKIALNKKIVINQELKSQDELAFLPPFSGG